MTFLRSLFFNFLAVFFVNRVIPDVQIGLFEKVPNIGADILFAFIVGFLNASISPVVCTFGGGKNVFKIFVLTIIVSFGSYLIIYFVPFGVHVETLGGWFFAGTVVWLCAFLTNYLEVKHYS